MTSLVALRSRLENRHDRLAMANQDLDRPFHDPDIPPDTTRGLSILQLLVTVVPAILALLLGLLLLSGNAVKPDLSITLAAVIATIIPFYWDAVAAVLAVLGLFWKPGVSPAPDRGLQIAILVLLYDDTPEPIIERAIRLLEKSEVSAKHSFSLHILSDSRKPESVVRESAVFQVLRRRYPQLEINYRHRAQNTDYKSGNIREWIRSDGHLHDAMFVLDADSAMGMDSILQMADALALDPSCGLVQSIPRVLDGATLWQRMQSHASCAMGTILGRGLSIFSGETANYYGHNAMLRIKALATSAGLPHLKGEAPFGGVIMSHDFVEAALLCRAGWSVRLMPEAHNSFEETPATLTGFLARDRRWCHGNMQHLMLLRVPGFRFISRFHLLQGAMTYLNAPLWLFAMVTWMLAPGLNLNVAVVVIGVVLFLPRVVGLWTARHSWSLPFAIKELTLSSLLAPSLIIQRTRMILSIMFGHSFGWTKSDAVQQPFSELLRFHVVEVATGIILSALIFANVITPWLIVVALSLLFAPALAVYVSKINRS
jgi:membrane glycosyltransferase